MTDKTENRPKDAPDPELVALAGAGRRPSILRPILMIAVIALGGWIISDWRAELEFFFSDSEPVELPSATQFAIERAEDPDWQPPIPHNRYVQIEGIPTQRSQSARYRFFGLVGAPIFVEQERDDYIEDPIERELEGDAKGDVDRTMYSGAGRALKFSEIPERYGGLRHYYATRYNIVFCESLDERAYRELEQTKRDAIIQQWRGHYKDSSPEDREAKGLTKEPTEEQIETIMAADPVCVEAWLIQDGVQPSDHWWYVAAAAMFGLFMLFNLVLLVRWVRDFARS